LTDIGLSIVFATLAAYAARLLRQPLILGYVLGGIALGGQLGFGLITGTESVELISEIGLILLLFIIGLEINVRELIGMGPTVFVAGVVQFAGCVGLGLLTLGATGIVPGPGKFDSLYLAIALALSSTLIVVKLLHDKFEIRTAAGRLTVGVLVLQDVWAILFMAIQPSLSNPEVLVVLRAMAQGIVLVCAAFLFSKHALGRILEFAGKSPELVVLTAMAWCFAMCGLAEKAGLSKEMGALVAGVTIAAFPYGTDVISKLAGIRDFFVTLFFVSLGLKVAQPSLGVFAGAGALALFVLVSRLLTLPPTTYLMKQGLRTGIVSGLNLAQISEFSLVIVTLGAGFGHVSSELQSLVLTATLVASVVSTYVIQFNHDLARPMLRLACRFGYAEDASFVEAASTSGQEPRDIVLLGCFRGGRAFLEQVEIHVPELRRRILVIDYNPALQADLERRGFKWAYGDLSHPETLSHHGIEFASFVICAVSDTFLKGTTNSTLLQHLKSLAPEACFVMAADDRAEADRLILAGAREVVVGSCLVGCRLLESVQLFLRGQFGQAEPAGLGEPARVASPV
jgi:Kef-type K+ transport system membrane component KefB